MSYINLHGTEVSFRAMLLKARLRSLLITCRWIKRIMPTAEWHQKDCVMKSCAVGVVPVKEMGRQKAEKRRRILEINDDPLKVAFDDGDGSSKRAGAVDVVGAAGDGAGSVGIVRSAKT